MDILTIGKTHFYTERNNQKQINVAFISGDKKIFEKQEAI